MKKALPNVLREMLRQLEALDRTESAKADAARARLRDLRVAYPVTWGMLCRRAPRAMGIA